MTSTASTAELLSEAAITGLVASQRKVLRSLGQGDTRAVGGHLRRDLGLRITYHRDEPGWAVVECRPACVNQPGLSTAEQGAADYGSLGLGPTYHVDQNLIEVEARPDVCTGLRVGGGTPPFRTRGKVQLRAA